MTNTKENKLDQMKQDLGDIQLDAKSLKIEIPKDDVKNDRLILTEVVKGNDSMNNFSNSEILSELHKQEWNINYYLDKKHKKRFEANIEFVWRSWN